MNARFPLSKFLFIHNSSFGVHPDKIGVQYSIFKKIILIITGGSRGIGAATAIMFAKAGADVAITYHKDKEAADSVVKEVKKIGRKAIAINGNVENAKDAKNIVSQTFKKFKRVDVNLKVTFNMCKAVVQIMRKQKYGWIIAFAKSLGSELIPNRIWVNCVAPGWVITDS